MDPQKPQDEPLNLNPNPDLFSQPAAEPLKPFPANGFPEAIAADQPIAPASVAPQPQQPGITVSPVQAAQPPAYPPASADPYPVTQPTIGPQVAVPSVPPPQYAQPQVAPQPLMPPTAPVPQFQVTPPPVYPQPAANPYPPVAQPSVSPQVIAPPAAPPPQYAQPQVVPPAPINPGMPPIATAQAPMPQQPPTNVVSGAFIAPTGAPVNTPPSSSTIKNNFFKIIAIALIVIVVGIGGFLGYKVISGKSIDGVANCGTYKATNSNFNKSPYTGCFDEHFKTCSPAEIVVDIDTTLGKGMVDKYQIEAKQGTSSCLVKWEYVVLPTNPSWDNKTVECAYPTNKEFEAALDAKTNLDGCTGSLVTLLAVQSSSNNSADGATTTVNSNGTTTTTAPGITVTSQ